MTLEELLKENPEVLSAVTSAIESANSSIEDANKKIKFVDLGEGGYVSNEKYNKLNTKYNELKTAPNEFETKYNELVASSATALEDEKGKFKGIVRSMAIDNKLAGLNINNPIMMAGLRSLIDPSKIEVDDSFKVTGGLDDQIEGLKTSYKDAFGSPKNVSMGNTVSKANMVGTPAKQYSSSEIDKMSIKDVMADIDNVVASLSNMK